MKTSITIDAGKAAPQTPKKKAPCKHSANHGGDGQGDNQGGDEGDSNEGDHDFNDGHDEHGGHTEEGGDRSRRSHRRPTIRARHSQDSRVRHSNLPRMREIINQYTIDLVENSDRY